MMDDLHNFLSAQDNFDLRENELRKNGMLLKSVPKEEQNATLCWYAIQQNSEALQFVREDLLTPEICIAAINRSKTYSSALRFVPKSLQTPEMCMAAVKKDGSSLKFVGDKTFEICMNAVLQIIMVLWNTSRKDLRIKYQLKGKHTIGILDWLKNANTFNKERNF